jgi:hypothetical protein
MKICEGNEKEATHPKSGNLYKIKGSDAIYIYDWEDCVVNIKTGYRWERNSTAQYMKNKEFTDVTDKYCLKRIDDE